MNDGLLNEEKSFEDILKEWATLTYDKYPKIVIGLLLDNTNNRRLGLEICEMAGEIFSEKIKLMTESEKDKAFYVIYKKKYKEYDALVRFGDELEQPWAMFVKMLALGMTYEEIIKDSKRRDSWTPLEEKKKDNW